MPKKELNIRRDLVTAKSMVHAAAASSCAILTAAVYICIASLQPQKTIGTQTTMEVAQPQGGRQMLVTEENLDAFQPDAEAPERVSPLNYEAVMNTEWVFADTDAASDNAYVENSRTNQTPVRLYVELEDGETPVYISPVLMPGEMLDEITLNYSLQQGVYNATARYDLLGEDGQVLGSVSVGMHITIQA